MAGGFTWLHLVAQWDQPVSAELNKTELHLKGPTEGSKPQRKTAKLLGWQCYFNQSGKDPCKALTAAAQPPDTILTSARELEISVDTHTEKPLAYLTFFFF